MNTEEKYSKKILLLISLAGEYLSEYLLLTIKKKKTYPL